MKVSIEVVSKNALLPEKSGKQSAAKPRAHVTFVSYSLKTVASKQKSVLNLKPLSSEESSVLADLHAGNIFTGAHKECLFYRDRSLRGAQHWLIVGLGSSEDLSGETVRQAAAAANQHLTAQKVAVGSVDIDQLGSSKKIKSQHLMALTQGLILSQYQIQDFKTPAETSTAKPEIFRVFASAKADIKAYQEAIEQGQIIAENTNLARWIGDCPGNFMNPEKLANTAKEKAKGSKLKVTVWDKNKIKKEKMGGLDGVSLGSVGGSEPKFIIMEYTGTSASKKPIIFVGKGLTFDCGGVSLKPSASMDEMKYDMCGGATVLATMVAIAQLKLKLNVIGLIPSTENMVGPLATKPGDILKARNGKTVEVLNTDAEGRLILMDALSYASEKKPRAIFDIATLTGAMVIALGSSHTGIFSNHDKVTQKVQKAADLAGEKVWRMPLDPDHLSDMKGTFADLANIGARREAGSAQAAAFLTEFVDKDIPYVHFDIAGTAWNVGHRLNYCQAKNASGTMVRTFVELAKLHI